MTSPLVLTATFHYYLGGWDWRCLLCDRESASAFLTQAEARDDWHENHGCPKEAPPLFDEGER